MLLAAAGLLRRGTFAAASGLFGRSAFLAAGFPARGSLFAAAGLLRRRPFLAAPAGLFLATLVLLVHRAPGALLRLFLRHAFLLVPFFDVFGFPLLLARVTGFVSARHLDAPCMTATATLAIGKSPMREEAARAPTRLN